MAELTRIEEGLPTAEVASDGIVKAARRTEAGERPRAGNSGLSHCSLGAHALVF